MRLPRANRWSYTGWLAITVLLALVLGLVAFPAYGDDLDDRMAAAKRKQQESEQQIGQLESELAETDAELADAYLKLQKVQAELPVAQANVSLARAEHEEAVREAESLATKLRDAQDEKTSLESQVEANDESMTQARAGVAEMARQAARGDLDMSTFGMVVGAQSTEDFVERYSMSNTALRVQSQSLSALRDAQALSRNAEIRLQAVEEIIAQLKKEADEQVDVAEQKEQAAEAAMREVENLIAQQEEAAAAVESRKEAAEQKLQSEEASANQLSREIRELAGLQEEQRLEEERKEKERQEAARKKAEEEAKKNNNGSSGGGSSGGSSGGGSSSGGSSGGGSSSGGSSGGSSSGKAFTAWPTAYRVVTSSYGWRLHPVLGYHRLHAGTDMRAYCGTPIYAARSGKVQWAKYYGGFGNQVLINHGSYNGKSLMSSYNHLTSFSVRSGQSVKAGQLLGYSGTTGTSTACHLHFEVYVNGSTVDPMTMM